MKKCICVILSMLLLISITGCYNEDNSNSPNTPTCNHSYSTATCLKRSQCTKCGYEIGPFAAHSYVDGVCIHCNTEDPNWQPRILYGDEYERINSKMEGMYQYRLSSGYLVEYHFKNGSFECYTELGSTILENHGTYQLTEKTLILYYQNGTTNDCRWILNDNNEIELFLLDLSE